MKATREPRPSIFSAPSEINNLSMSENLIDADVGVAKIEAKIFCCLRFTQIMMASFAIICKIAFCDIIVDLHFQFCKVTLGKQPGRPMPQLSVIAAKGLSNSASGAKLRTIQFPGHRRRLREKCCGRL